VAPKEIEMLFEKWNRVSNNTDFVNYEQFEKVFLESLPWWRHGVEEIFKVKNST
jgi:hypothetical protein